MGILQCLRIAESFVQPYREAERVPDEDVLDVFRCRQSFDQLERRVDFSVHFGDPAVEDSTGCLERRVDSSSNQ